MKHVHLIGIGGSGLSAIARVLLESGIRVSGSDRASSPAVETLTALGVRTFIGHAATHITGADVVVRSSAVSEDNPEVQAARAAGIPVEKRSEFLARLLAGKRGLAVAGTHGKTTTTAMLAWALTRCGQDPSYIVGGLVKNLDSNAHAGQGPVFVIEADEYDGMFLGLRPEIAVVTNIEHDHPDCYPSLVEYRQAFVDFAGKIMPHGCLLACQEDPGARWLLAKMLTPGLAQFSYGFSKDASYQATQVKSNDRGGFDFTAACQAADRTTFLADVSLQVPGRHNVLNALAALAAVHQLGQPVAAAAEALGEFSGTGRRFDLRAELNGIVLIDDYAHHPTEIRATLAAARARYPERRIWAVWQPHTYSRTQTLESDFAAAFADADQVLVTKIYAAREAPQTYSAATAAGRIPNARYTPELDDAAGLLQSELRSGDVLLVFSAGNADQITAWLLQSLVERMPKL